MTDPIVKEWDNPTFTSSAATLDIPRARKVLEHLRAHPEEHRQIHFGMRRCGTTACIAGTTVLLEPDVDIHWQGDIDMHCVKVDGRRMEVDAYATKLLGLSHYDAAQLFYEFNDAKALNMLAELISDAEKAQADVRRQP